VQGVAFLGFAGDCSIAGQVTMFGERMTDFLNGQERFRVHHVECTSLADGHVVKVDSISLERDELLAVIGTGPRGAEHLRVEVDETRLQLAIGPYLILGRFHTRPGVDAIDNVLHREAMIPLTGATIAYQCAGETVARDVGTVIVNRHQVAWIAASEDEASVFPGASLRSPFTMNLRKDFTGSATL